jgi:hypothetical protein
MPVARQNAVLDASTVEWEAHMRTAVVQGKDSTLVFDYQNGAMRAADDEPAFAREFLDRACALEFGAHNHASSGRSMGTTLGCMKFGAQRPLPTSSSMCAAGARRAFPTGRLASRVLQ